MSRNAERRAPIPWVQVVSTVAIQLLALCQISCLAKPGPQPAQEDVTAPLVEEVDRLFQARSFYYTGGRYQNQWFPYRLYVPPHLEPQKKYPLLLWFHGAGESGTDNVKNMMHVDGAVQHYLNKNRSIPAFILVPQSPSVERGWFSSPAAKDDMLTVTWAMLEKTIRENPIDPDRVISSGVSSGGTACWEMALRHPETFAAIAPVASGGADRTRASVLVRPQIWAFHNVDDLTTSVEGDRATIALINDAGGHAHLTEFPRGGHAAWTPAFNEHGMLEWLLARHRGESSLAVSLSFANWPVIAAQFGLPLLILVACIYEVRRQYRLKTTRTHAFAEARLPDFGELIETKR